MRDVWPAKPLVDVVADALLAHVQGVHAVRDGGQERLGSRLRGDQRDWGRRDRGEGPPGGFVRRRPAVEGFARGGIEGVALCLAAPAVSSGLVLLVLLVVLLRLLVLLLLLVLRLGAVPRAALEAGAREKLALGGEEEGFEVHLIYRNDFLTFCVKTFYFVCGFRYAFHNYSFIPIGSELFILSGDLLDSNHDFLTTDKGLRGGLRGVLPAEVGLVGVRQLPGHAPRVLPFVEVDHFVCISLQHQVLIYF